MADHPYCDQYQDYISYTPQELLFYHILPHLPIKQMLALGQTCKYFYESITDDKIALTFKPKIEARLEELFGDSISLVYELLENNRAAITGSFVLQAIHDEYYILSNLDIIIPMNTQYYQFIDRIAKGFTGRSPLLTSREYYEHGIIIELGPKEEIIYDCWVEKMKVDLKFRIISSSLQEYVEGYDFTLLKNLYRRSCGRGTLDISDKDAIIKKSLRLDSLDNTSPSRIFKYIDRGFNIDSSRGLVQDWDILALIASDAGITVKCVDSLYSWHSMMNVSSHQPLLVCDNRYVWIEPGRTVIVDKDIRCHLCNFKNKYKHFHMKEYDKPTHRRKNGYIIMERSLIN